MTEQKFCQSCGMPLDSTQVLETNADQSKNEDYCVNCFKDDSFRQGVTMQEMIDISLYHMKEMFANDPNFSEQEALSKMRTFFPELKRWKA